MTEMNSGRSEETSDAIKFAFAEGLISTKFYQDLTHLLWQANKTPELEGEVTKLNHEIWRLRNGRVFKEWENDQLRIIAERKRLEEENKRLRVALVIGIEELTTILEVENLTKEQIAECAGCAYNKLYEALEDSK